MAEQEAADVVDEEPKEQEPEEQVYEEPKEEEPAAEEPADEEPKEEEAKDEPEQYEEPKEEEVPKEEEPPKEEPADQEPAYEEPPKEEPPKEEPVYQEPPKDEEPKEEPPKEEELKEEPKQKEEPPKKPKKKSKKKKKKTKKTNDDGNDDALKMWKKISAKKGSEINWYILKLKGKVGKTTELEFVQEGTGGASQLIEFLSDQNKSMRFGIMKCITTDDAMSVRSKFIYIRFVGSGVKTMSKAKLTGSIGKIDDHFPCKHLTVDLSEKCADDLAPKNLAKELLRVGGAHKPDKMNFGPDQDVDVKSM